MNGKLRQKEIQAETSINAGHLSTLVGQLGRSKLLTGDPKLPQLVISVPSNFFDLDAKGD